MTSVSPLLELAEVSVRLGEQTVLDRVSLSVGAGEVVGLAGPNGAGKTTLLRVASRLLAVQWGEVRLGGQPLAGIARRELARRLAVVPQDSPTEFPYLAGEIVLMGRTPHLPLFGFESRADVARALAAMERIGIADLANRSFSTLSGGERQLVLIARALVQEPQLLLLDEPTSHLDLRHRVEVLRQVRGFADAGGGAVVVTHDLGVAARLCDRLVLLADARVLGSGPPADVIEPGLLERAFGVKVQVERVSDGTPLVLPTL